MLRIGIAGIGFMGMIHYLAWRRVKGAKVTAISTRDAKKLAGDWRSIKGNFGPPGEQMDLRGVAAHREIDALLADPRVDAIDVCLPPALHADVTVAALKAGKHVICEKPIALTTAEADRMVRAAESSGKLLLIAQVLPFTSEFGFAYRTISGGKYGRMLGGHFKRIISDPLWIPDFYNPATVGGPVVDLHIHDAHFIRLACGMPQGVFSRGRMRGDVVEFFTTQFLFADPTLQVTATSGVIGQQGRSFTHGFEIQLERATLLYDFAMIGPEPVTAMPLTVLTNDGKAARPKLGSGDMLAAFVGELTEATKSIRSGKPSPLLSGDLARDALVLCHKQTQSVRQGRVVRTGY